MYSLKAGRYVAWQALLSFELLTIPAGGVKVYRSMDRTLTRDCTSLQFHLDNRTGLGPLYPDRIINLLFGKTNVVFRKSEVSQEEFRALYLSPFVFRYNIIPLRRYAKTILTKPPTCTHTSAKL